MGNTTYAEIEDACQELGLPYSTIYPLAANAAAAQANVTVGAGMGSHFAAGMRCRLATRVSDVSDTPLQIENVKVLSVAGDVVTMTAVLARTFNTASYAYIQVACPYTLATTPTYTQQESIIRRLEDWVDGVTHTTWKSKVSTETHSFHPSVYKNIFPYSNALPIARNDMQNKIQLSNRPVTTMSTTINTAYTGYLGDYLMVWDGGRWIEIFNATNPGGATAVSLWTQGRNNDWYLDELSGDLFFVGQRPAYAPFNVKIQYRWGRTRTLNVNTPGETDIERALILAFCLHVLKHPYTIQIPGGTEDRLALVSAYEKEMWSILRRHAEIPYESYDEIMY